MFSLASQQTRMALRVVQQRSAYDGGELMSDRRAFLQGVVALALVAAVPALPLDDWDLFLSGVRERLIKLTRDGYQIENLEISPDCDGQRLVQVWVSHEYSIVKSVVWWQKTNAQ
jgi:hypothetical protein